MAAMSLRQSPPELGTKDPVEQGGLGAEAPLPDLVPPGRVRLFPTTTGITDVDTCCEMGPVNVFNVYFLIQISQPSPDMGLLLHPLS